MSSNNSSGVARTLENGENIERRLIYLCKYNALLVLGGRRTQELVDLSGDNVCVIDALPQRKTVRQDSK